MILGDNALCIEDANDGRKLFPKPYICGLEGECYKEYGNYNRLWIQVKILQHTRLKVINFASHF